MADEHELLSCHPLQPAPDEQDLLSSADDSMSCRLTGLTGNPAGFHSHQLQHSTRLLQLMTGGLRARQGTQAMIKARMLASSASGALAGRLRARGAKEGGFKGLSGAWLPWKHPKSVLPGQPSPIRNLQIRFRGS